MALCGPRKPWVIIHDPGRLTVRHGLGAREWPQVTLLTLGSLRGRWVAVGGHGWPWMSLGNLMGKDEHEVCEPPCDHGVPG